MKSNKPEKTDKVSPGEISELEKTIKESEEDKKEEPETQKEFEINPDFAEDLNLIDIPLPQTEPIFQRIQDSEESLDQNLRFALPTKSRDEKYDDSKYDSKYFENKYSAETPNYAETPKTEKKETSDKRKNQVNQFR